VTCSVLAAGEDNMLWGIHHGPVQWARRRLTLRLRWRSESAQQSPSQPTRAAAPWASAPPLPLRRRRSPRATCDDSVVSWLKVNAYRTRSGYSERSTVDTGGIFYYRGQLGNLISFDMKNLLSKSRCQLFVAIDSTNPIYQRTIYLFVCSD
jgi:hypothetical protein